MQCLFRLSWARSLVYVFKYVESLYMTLRTLINYEESLRWMGSWICILLSTLLNLRENTPNVLQIEIIFRKLIFQKGTHYCEVWWTNKCLHRNTTNISLSFSRLNIKTKIINFWNSGSEVQILFEVIYMKKKWWRGI